MSHPYTDRYGYPITSVEALRRLNARRPNNVYIDGKWVPVTSKRVRDAEHAAEMASGLVKKAGGEPPTNRR